MDPAGEDRQTADLSIRRLFISSQEVIRRHDKTHYDN